MITVCVWRLAAAFSGRPRLLDSCGNQALGGATAEMEATVHASDQRLLHDACPHQQGYRRPSHWRLG